MQSNTNRELDVAQTLGVGTSPSRFKRLKLWIIIAIIIVAAITAFLILKNPQKADAMIFKTQESRRGDITVTVLATGNLEPTNQVDVSTEVSGTVAEVSADYNDQVKVGQVLARLDTSKLEAQVKQSKAALTSARAAVINAQATVKEARANLGRLRQVWELSGHKVPSQNDLDAAEAALERAQANEASAEADVLKAQATLTANETDLAKAVIRSPINGVILARSVEPGQTVAASLSAPVLFTLAEDLTKMELHVDVDEADVGQVKAGQEAVFSVDAYPNREFQASIIQVRYSSQTVDGVVTYETVLKVDNSDLMLRPGMTATAEIITKKVQDAVLIPNAALRFTPPVMEAPSQRSGLIDNLLPHPPRRRRPESRQKANGNQDKKEQRVWTLRDGRPFPLTIATGETDDTWTEVIGDGLAPGTPLVVDAVSAGK